jgi:hypothetical protein
VIALAAWPGWLTTFVLVAPTYALFSLLGSLVGVDGALLDAVQVAVQNGEALSVDAVLACRRGVVASRQGATNHQRSAAHARCPR